jgi:hypothetical protein
MLTKDPVLARPIRPPKLEEEHLAPGRQVPRPEVSVPSLLGRLVVVAAGFGLALTGWMLVMTVLLVFIGLPMFFFGLAVMQTQER